MKWAASLVALVLVWLAAVGAWIYVGPSEESGSRADAAIVLGAAVDGNIPSPVFAARIDHSIELYKAGRAERLVFTGAASPEDTLSESAAARKYASERGVLQQDILIEQRSRTTRQNLAEARKALSDSDNPQVLIVSDPLHLRRALLMARDLGFDAEASATTTTRYRSWRTKLPFLLREIYFLHHYWLFGE
jgi:uncharacterized SAM-binding protein YcdF (DUF218 family)